MKKLPTKKTMDAADVDYLSGYRPAGQLQIHRDERVRILADGRPKTLGALVAACALFSAAAQNAPFITRPEEIEALRREPSREFIASDARIGFVPVSDERGKSLGHIVVEIGPADEPSKLAQSGQYFRTPTDLLRAFTKPRRGISKVPSFPEGNGVTDCEASWPQFEYDVLSWGYGLSFLSASDGPSAGTGHWSASGGFSAGFYELHGRVDDVSAFFLKIQFCYEDPIAPPFQGNEGSSVDPEIFLYFRVGNAQWSLLNSGFHLDAGEQISFWWHPVSEQLPGVTATQLDFKVNLYDAAPDDRFHIGATWSKPFDTLTDN
jgi:hypothetical protein